MVNFGLNSASILGIFLAVAGAGLYFLRSIRPELARDHDIFFAAVGLLCGLILLFQGWRLDPILQFGQFLLTGSAIFFAVESIRLRGATVEQAKRGGSYVDRDRPVSRTSVYTEAELDEIEPYNEEPNYDSPRLQGYTDPRSPRRSRVESDPPRSSSSRRRPPSETYGTEENYRSRRPRPSNPRSRTDSREDPSDMWEEPSPSRRRPPTRPDSDYSEEREQKPQKRRSRSAPPSYDNYYPDAEVTPVDYVDYQPVDESDPPDSEDDWDEPTPPSRPEPPNRNYPREEDETSNDPPIRFDY